MIHRAASDGYQQRSDTYASVRPSYHPDVLDAVAAAIDGPVIDLGAGTGISTAALVARDLAVTAVEPVPAMRDRLREALPDVTVLEGTAESIPVADSSVAAVVVAQAFHWFDHGPALDEIARVLAPGGHLVTLWNVRDESVPWVAALTAVQDVHQGDTPRYRTRIWRRAIEADTRFALATEVQTPNPQPSSVDGVLARSLSTSFIAALDDEAQALVVDQIREVVADLGETFDYPYWTEAQIWRYG